MCVASSSPSKDLTEVRWSSGKSFCLQTALKFKTAGLLPTKAHSPLVCFTRSDLPVPTVSKPHFFFLLMHTNISQELFPWRPMGGAWDSGLRGLLTCLSSTVWPDSPWASAGCCAQAGISAHMKINPNLGLRELMGDLASHRYNWFQQSSGCRSFLFIKASLLKNSSFQRAGRSQVGFNVNPCVAILCVTSGKLLSPVAEAVIFCFPALLQSASYCLFRLALNLESSFFYLLSAGTTGVQHHAHISRWHIQSTNSHEICGRWWASGSFCYWGVTWSWVCRGDNIANCCLDGDLLITFDFMVISQR